MTKASKEDRKTIESLFAAAKVDAGKHDKLVKQCEELQFSLDLQRQSFWNKGEELNANLKEAWRRSQQPQDVADGM